MTDTEDAWQQRVDDFWQHGLDDADADGSIARMRALVAERADGDAIALFELAGVHDAVGRESDAEPLYRRALAAGLDADRAVRARIQLASTLRNLDRVDEAIRLLEQAPASDLDGERRAFLALALRDAGRTDEALRTVLEALIPTLGRYRRSLAEYAAELGGVARE